MNKEVLIVTGGTIEIELLKKLIDENDYFIIGVDGGINALDKIGCVPSMVIGDFDSINTNLILKYKSFSNAIILNPMKDYTDTHSAVLEALILKPSSITIVGAIGTRIDHVLANVGLLKLGIIHKIPIQIINKNNRIRLIDKKIKIKKTDQYGKYISFLPFSEEVSDICMKGFKYPMNNESVFQGQSIGISNELEKEEGFITIGKGYLLVMETKD